jgi:hypothetical protein
VTSWPAPGPQPPSAPRTRINADDRFELRDWAVILETTPEQLLEAVRAVGNRADDVRDWLRAHERE